MLDLGAATARHRRIGDAVVRLGEPSDLPRIAELAGQTIHPEATEEIWALAAQTRVPFLVVDVGGVPAAASAVFTGSLDLAGVQLGYVQPEFVATDPTHRQRGFASAMVDVVLEAAAAADLPLSLVSGIEYFYRRFGYSYAVAAPRRHTLTELPGHSGDEWTCRTADERDIVGLDALQDSVQRHADVTIRSSPERWRWLSAVSHYEVVVAERDGRLEAMARLYADDSGVELTETAARSVPAADAVLDHVGRRHRGHSITVPDRPGGGGAFLDRRASMVLEREAFYLRPTSLVGLVTALVPVFEARLARSSHAGQSVRLPLSFYGSGVLVDIVDGSLAGLSTFTPAPGPASVDHVSIAPDRLVDLAFGDLGAAGVEERNPDVVLGDHRQLMSTLFPPVTADFLLF